jgi:hypothetical protein
MINLKHYRSRLNKNLTFTLLVSVLTVTGIVSGVVPQLSLEKVQLSFSNVVLASNVSDGDLQKYAQAAKRIENLRISALSRIEQIVGKQKTAQLACHQPNTINALPADAQNIARDYCQKSENIVKQSGLSISKFNDITRAIQQDSSLQQKVQNMMR